MYKIGSFNCLNLGRAANKDIDKFVDIIKTENFDIIALQEIKGQMALDRILNRLGANWKGVADDGYSNDYAFIWNKTRVELANALEAGKNRVYEPRIYKQYKVDRKAGQKDLVREPYYARFFPTGGGAPYIELRIINTHIRFSKGAEENDNSIGAVAMRRNEFDVLTRAIYAKEADKRYGNNRPAYTILLGDYNLNLPTSMASTPYLIESFEIVDGTQSKVIVTVQKELSTLTKKSEAENIQFANNYDHFTYDTSRFGDIVVSCNRINTVEKYCGGDQEKHLKDVSDHVPIVMDIDFRR